MSDFEVVLAKLSERRVRFLVVGGVAVVLHGYQRLTADLDLIVDLRAENVLLAVTALGELGFHPRAPVAAADFANADVRQSWVRDKGLVVFSMWSKDHPNTEVDIFAESPIPFDEAFARSASARIGDDDIRYASIDDLIALKTLAGRPKDLLDIEELVRIKGRRQP